MNIFARLRTPKWKNRKAEVRRDALLTMGSDDGVTQAVIVQLAQEDPDANVRSVACRRLRDIHLLQQIAASDRDAEVSATAQQRFLQLLSGNADSTPPLNIRLRLTDAIDDEATLELIARKGNEGELRLRAVTRMTRQSLLGDIAISDSDPDVRYAAAEKILQRSTLERVLKRVRKRDKRVAARLREQLQQLDEAQKLPQHLVETGKKCCQSIAALIRQCKQSGNWSQAERRRDELKSRWQSQWDQWQEALDTPWPADLSQRFSAVCDEFEEAFAQHQQREAEQRHAIAERAPALSQMLNICEEIEALLQEIKESDVPGEHMLSAMEPRFNRIRVTWQQAREDGDVTDSEVDSRFAIAQQNVRYYLKDRRLYQQAVAELTTLSSRCEKLLGRSLAEQADELKELEQAWQTITQPEHFALPGDVVTTLEQQLNQLRAHSTQHQEQQQESLALFQQTVEQLAQALAEGQSKRSAQLANHGKKLLAGLSDSTTESLRKQGLLANFHQQVAKADELKSWRNWSDAPVRESLCKRMERLAKEVTSQQNNPHYDLVEVARLVRAARDEWKTLSSAGRNDNKLWQRFDHACSQAYEPCQTLFEQQASLREVARQQKTIVCDDLEQYAQLQAVQIENGEVDWKAAENIVRLAEQEWRRIGPLPHQHQSALNNRFRKVLDTLRTATRSNRKRNAEQKTALLERAQALCDTLKSDPGTLHNAISEIKRIQSQWKEIGPAHRDGELWKQMRTASDTIFAQRSTQSEQRKQMLDDNLEQKKRLCENVLHWSDLQGDALKQACAQVAQAKQQWQQIGPVAKADSHVIEHEFEHACTTFDTQNRMRISDEARAARLQQQKKSVLCHQLECAVATFAHNLANRDEDQPAAAAPSFDEKSEQTFQQEWQSLSSDNSGQDSLVDKALEQRFNAALTLLEQARQQPAAVAEKIDHDHSTNLPNRAQLCLQIEILTNTESPAALKQARMEVQMALLAEGMGGGADLSEQVHALEKRWYNAAWAIDEEALALEQRFHRSREAYYENLA
ncbi:MAG: DUF349 domain-containing protein [Gammaproteobacteria bacterium]|nr:DUF349 domain-containing protein [Gammaproteobacteria bacterium]